MPILMKMHLTPTRGFRITLEKFSLKTPLTCPIPKLARLRSSLSP